MPDNDGGQLAQVKAYRQLVAAYETLDGRIDELVAAGRGRSEGLSASELLQYRAMARKRTELLNDMRRLEQQLNLSGDDAPGANKGADHDHRSHI